MKRITAVLAVLATIGLAASPALAGNKFRPTKPSVRQQQTLHYQTFPYRSGRMVLPV